MNITRRIHLNPQSKGSLGKSFEAEFRTAWLDSLGVPWTGSDLDDRHHTFADRHPEQVQSYGLGNEDDSKSTLLGLFRRVSLSDVPVHIIDCRAQADSLIVQALEQLQVLETLAAAGVRFTFFLFPSEDTESMNNLMDLFYFAGDRVDYVIVHNRAKVRADLFHKSGLEAELLKFGARSRTLPVVTPITLPGFVGEHVIGVETRFAVSAVLEGDKALRDFVFHHYRTTDGSNIPHVPNGPTFISFDPAANPTITPRTFILFLIREADGRHAPIVGQTDPGGAVRELRGASR